MIEEHPIKPFLPSQAVLLFLGSFPPKKERWTMNFFYPNWQNDFWRIIGLAFFQDKNHFLNLEAKMFKEYEIKAFLTQKKIALYDSAEKIIRRKNNASDQFLELVEPINLQNYLIRLPHCQTIAATGQKALQIILQQISRFSNILPTDLKMGEFLNFEFEQRQLRLYRMPSSSRAFPLSLVNKTIFYQKMFNEIKVQ
ncbi:MAG: uracil-DNA glycosylase family protein [Planctomycetia bacterium]|nr:uracil-DNA glycosylase family protein [Planctomycetia bacterium]